MDLGRLYSGMTTLSLGLLLSSCLSPQQQFPIAAIPAPLKPVSAPLKPESTSTPKRESFSAPSPISLPPDEAAEFLKVIQTAHQQNLQARPLGEVIQAIAQQFLGKPYQAELLDRSPHEPSREPLFLSLKRFDCVLLIETVVALAHNIVHKDDSVDTFAHNVQSLRYRSGQRAGYCSRLHYFSDWIADNEKRGLVQNLTATLGGVNLPQTFNFMTNHRNLYPQLNSDPEFQCIQQVEARLDQSHPTFIPTAKIRDIYPSLQSGDIIAVVTTLPGLDVTHTGFIERQGKVIGLIHASPGGTVKRALDLQTYVSRVELSRGIFIVRPL